MPVRKILILTTVWILAFICGRSTCHAQSLVSTFQSYKSVQAVEKFLGPIVPVDGFGSTFRSEMGGGLFSSVVQKAQLTGASAVPWDIRGHMQMSKEYITYDFYGDIRFWRFGLRGAYTYLNNPGEHPTYGGFDFTGASVGADFDVVQLNWLTIGACADYYLVQPRLRGSFLDPASGRWDLQVDLQGKRPVTAGVYFRHVPPDILGFPMHFEGFLKLPVKGSRLTSYGLAATFRPQMYRFDLAAKVLFQDKMLTFGGTPELSGTAPQTTQPSQPYDLEMVWRSYGLEVSVYF